MMGLMCAIGGHEAAPREVYNCGYWFSRCRGCGCDMIRTGAGWSMVPEGHRVVWKAGRQSHSLTPDFGHVLPVLLRTANLPAPRSPFLSWSRTLSPKRRGAALAFAREVPGEVQEPQYPVLLVVAAMVGAGMQLLLGFGRPS
jgi:hypothetical protein